MNEGFWHKVWPFALLLAVVAMIGVTIVALSGDLSPADVREIIADEGIQPGDGAGWALDEPIRPELTPVSQLEHVPEAEAHITYAPAVPAPITRTDQGIIDVHLESIEGVCPLDPATGVSTDMWGFRIAGDTDVSCGSPGPVLRGRVGDVVRISLTNLEGNTHPHNIDFHAVTGQGGGAADLTVNPGETATIQIRLLYPGTFMYHCAYGDVPVHIAHGMYGMFIVDPETPLPSVDHEWALMQSEWYVGEPGADGVAPFDADALFDEEPRFITFNGRTDALTGDNTLRMQVGERARIYFVNEGLNLDSNFHPIGSHWDAVYPEGATHEANRVIRGSQSTLVVAGGGTVVEIDALVPATIILVDHALVRTFYKGAIGTIVVEGPENHELFEALTEGTGERDHDADESTTTTSVEVGAEVTIPLNAFRPENAETAFSPREIIIPAGTTVRWVNEDSTAHTVTSGESDGTSGTPDGLFDSGFLDPGDTFTFTFTEPGTYPYFCLPHPWMIGTITVTG
ncbi:MAG TPA: plastocyanin/azurin family copper-binding protein [Acidimicrobiia bacterium]|nr:plastocyanin/azurin family copper-binding protein [Acidimicrobiia bacterium]